MERGGTQNYRSTFSNNIDLLYSARNIYLIFPNQSKKNVSENVNRGIYTYLFEKSVYIPLRKTTLYYNTYS